MKQVCLSKRSGFDLCETRYTLNQELSDDVGAFPKENSLGIPLNNYAIQDRF